MSSGKYRVLGLLGLALLLPACGVQGTGTLTPTVAPAIPSNLRLREGNRSVTLTWNASAAGAQYEVQRSVNPGGPFFPTSVASRFRTPTCYVDSDLTNGTTYYYQVVAENAFGRSSPSVIASGTPHFRATSIVGAQDGVNCVALLPDGSVWEWGGTASFQSSDVPVQTPGLFDITAISSGLDHNLALGSDGTVWAWGRDTYGQIGDAAPPANIVVAPTAVPSLTGIIAVAAGARHSLALDHNGRVWVWGANTEGQFGEGSTTSPNTSVPRQVPGLSGIIAISAGTLHSLALRNDGLLFAWGTNQYGQLGNGATSTAPSPPTLVPNLNGVVAIAAGAENSMILRQDGTVWLWGQNYYGIIGNGSSGSLTPVTVPTPVSTLTGVVAIGCGAFHACAIRADGSVWVWGDNSFGQIANGTKGSTPVPTPWKVPGAPSAVQIAGTIGDCLALAADGTVWAWGDNVHGQLGNGTGQFTVVPAEVPNLTGMVSAASGARSSYVLRSDGQVLAWGLNDWSELGNNTTTINPVPTPLLVPGVSTAKMIAGGFTHAMALLSTGTVVGWGQNTRGEVGIGSTSSYVGSPTAVAGLSGITYISCGGGGLHGLAIRNDQTLWVWGNNQLGELGTGSTAASVPTPFNVTLPAGVVTAAFGGSHCIALLSDGTVWVWGDNFYGQLGMDPVAVPHSYSPIRLAGMTGVVALAAGPAFNLVLKNDGTVWAWGQGNLGQLGDGSMADSIAPVKVSGLSGVTAITTGTYIGLALLGDGTVWSWGSNTFGELGNPVSTGSGVPVPVVGLTGVTSISAGDFTGVVTRSNQTVWTWGSNDSGQLGVPSVTLGLSPVMIPD